MDGVQTRRLITTVLGISSEGPLCLRVLHQSFLIWGTDLPGCIAGNQPPTFPEGSG